MSQATTQTIRIRFCLTSTKKHAQTLKATAAVTPTMVATAVVTTTTVATAAATRVATTTTVAAMRSLLFWWHARKRAQGSIGKRTTTAALLRRDRVALQANSSTRLRGVLRYGGWSPCLRACAKAAQAASTKTSRTATPTRVACRGSGATPSKARLRAAVQHKRGNGRASLLEVQGAV